MSSDGRLFLNHPLIKENTLEEREYQLKISSEILKNMENTLVVLPTGVGKTEIAIIIIAEILMKKGPKVLFLAPTRPLVLQHRDRLLKYLKNEKIVALTGNVDPDERGLLWIENDIIVSTPQVIRNDIISGLIDPAKVTLLIVDEAHRSVGKYAYTFVTEQCSNALIVGLTASPGSKPERIEEIMRHLNIRRLQVKSERDEDVKPYVHEIKLETIMLDFPDEYEPLREKLREVIESLSEELKNKFKDVKINGRLTKKKILEIQKSFSEMISKGMKTYYEGLSLLAMMLKVEIALEYLETQGINTCHEYLEQLVHSARMEDAKRTDVRLNKLRGFQEAVIMARDISKMEIISPKLKKIEDLVREQIARNKQSRIIIFTNYRNINQDIYEMLLKVEGVRPSRFLGQASRGEDRGMSQKEQEEILRKFRNNEINVLISTQIGEEGLDIPETDLVIFHEPVSSEIRNIQRRGRTGRARPGRVVILVYRNTIDEIMFYAGIKKEKKMKQRITELTPRKKKGQYSLLDFQ
ncbi:MAG: helicase-related protein [Thermoplasmata archaeon]|jgi:Fanconi anemia group M protein